MTHGHTTPQPPSSAPSHPSKVSSFKDHHSSSSSPELKQPLPQVHQEPECSQRLCDQANDRELLVTRVCETAAWFFNFLNKIEWIGVGGGLQFLRWLESFHGGMELLKKKVHPRHIIHFVLIKCLTKISQSLQLIQLVGDPLTETCVQYN